MTAGPRVSGRDRPVLVMGNGPSAKLVDFERLRGGDIATVGMNAAYRYWDRIDFRPTYYICMDSVLILSHVERIAEMIREGRVEKFFLRDEFRQALPEFDGHPRIFWFDDARGRAGSIFDTHFVTTGSWAIRWMAHEGHRLIAVIGVDTNYVELLAEAKRLGEGEDLRLELSQTPKFNPNYFFSDYQQAGDRYNIPNSPEYLNKTGRLVHVDALRRARDDLQSLGMQASVIDCSPISSHGIFPKIDIQRFFEPLQLSLVTSFFFNAPADELENNLGVAVANASNPQVARLSILFEGEAARLEEKVSANTMRAVRALESKGRLQFVRTGSRPDYSTLFELARSTGTEICAVANADILLDGPFLSGFLSRYAASSRPLVALTRWNRTPSGLYLQGLTPSPPWAETPLEQLAYNQVNYLSFDTYVFDARTKLPQGLSQVNIGTFGCDTAVAALCRVAGIAVVNPCLAHQTTHVDDKIRSYASDTGQAQMRHNTGVVRDAVLKTLAGHAAPLARTVARLEQLRPAVASFGTPHALGMWHCIMRLLGAAPWGDAIEPRPTEFRKFVIVPDALAREAKRLCEELSAAMASNAFVEIEVAGEQPSGNYLNLFVADAELRDLRARLYRYNWQSVIFTGSANTVELETHADMLLLLRRLLTMGTGCLARPDAPALLATSIHWAPRAVAAEGVATPVAVPVQPAVPRLLMIDSTPVGHTSATGQVKLAFLGDWPAGRFLQVWESYGAKGGLHAFERSQDPNARYAPEDEPGLIDRCVAFAPDVVYVRPIDSARLLGFTLALLSKIARPVVVHMMDDWPERLRHADRPRHARMDAMLRSILMRASVRLSICDEMSAAYARRYGGEWVPLANGVDATSFPAKDWASRPAVSPERPFVLRYTGGLADDMCSTSVADVARVVASLQGERAIRFEVCTMPWYREQAEALARMAGVSTHPLVEQARYARSLSEADALLIAYNFDEASKAYVGLSLANKMPECLASGVPVFAYGPPNAPTIRTLRAAGCAQVVTTRQDAELRRELLRLVDDRAHTVRLGAAGRAWATEHLSLDAVRKAFRRAIMRAVLEPVARPDMLMVINHAARFDRIATEGGLEARGRNAWESSQAGPPAVAVWRAEFVLSDAARQRDVVALLGIRADRATEARSRIVASGRSAPAERWEASRLRAGEKQVLCALGTVDPAAARVHVEVSFLAEAGFSFEVESLSLVVLDPQAEVPGEGETLAKANHLFRSGQHALALRSYARLYRNQPMSIYAANALLCARRLSGAAHSASGA